MYQTATYPQLALFVPLCNMYVAALYKEGDDGGRMQPSTMD